MEIITNEQIAKKNGNQLSYDKSNGYNRVIDITYEEDKEKKKLKITNKDLLQILLSLLFILILFKFIIISIRIDGSSMEPSYYNGERGVMLRITPINQPQRYDVVVFDGKTNYNEDELIVKRLFGMPGDWIEIKNNTIYINDSEVDDPYRNPNTIMQDYPKTYIDENKIFVLGDNRNNSRDSRSVGLIDKNDLVATHGIMFWPVNKIGLIN